MIDAPLTPDEINEFVEFVRLYPEHGRELLHARSPRAALETVRELAKKEIKKEIK